MGIKHQAYEVIKTETLREQQTEATLLRHKKTGARIVLMSNNDENKVFCIGFRTPPADDTGLPHILEHSVLCGSDKYPVKEVFVELCKGSLNTFLNAITYPDKTIYPVASCNDKDFRNLMDVYLSSVLHPSIYDHPEIFMQEGWRYDMESVDGPITINGVVYNEMKGAFSSPEEVLGRHTKKALFPDNTYAFESGGDPEAIPKLTYEQFIAFHQKYYHPSNSYIYLYGNMDMEENLAWLDREYLSAYERRDVDSEIFAQAPFAAPLDQEIAYSIGEGETKAGRAWLSADWGLTTDQDTKLELAFDILGYALMETPGAPLKQALLDAGIGKDVYGGYGGGMKQSIFSVVAKDADAERKEEFLNIIRETLDKICSEGMDRQTLRAGLSHYEFHYRESDYGSAPKGLIYGMQCMQTWLYDDNAPWSFLPYEDDFAWMREKVEENGYFEGLIRTWLLDNPHMVRTTLVPEPGLAGKRDDALAKKLAEKKASMSETEVQELFARVQAFKAWQAKEDSEEDLRKVPLLAVSDISTEAEKFIYTEKQIDGCKVVHTDLFTGGINYVKLLVSIDGISAEELHWLALLNQVWGQVNTENYSYLELSNEVHIQTGGIGNEIMSYQSVKNPSEYKSYQEFTFKTLYNKTAEAVKLVEEIALHSDYTSVKRLREVIAQAKSGLQMYLMEASHAAAMLRAQAYASPYSAFGDHVKGVGFYRFIEDLDAHFDERSAEIVNKLQKTAERILQGEVLLQITADNEGYAIFVEAVKPLLEKIGNGNTSPKTNVIDALGRLNEGFKTSGSVQYVARGGNFRRAGFAYTGALQVLRTMLRYDYLWTNLRIKGGAYGCMCGFGKSGDAYLSSYRDPHLTRTNETYKQIPAYLRELTLDERERTKYIIGTIGELDTPRTPRLKGLRALSAYLSGVTNEMQADERREILNCTEEDLRALAPLMEAFLAQDQLCVIGSEGKIEAERELFTTVEPLSAEG